MGAPSPLGAMDAVERLFALSRYGAGLEYCSEMMLECHSGAKVWLLRGGI